MSFLLKAKAEGKTVCGYGAAAKGNTLINFAGIRPDLISCVADKALSKQGKFMPGSRIPIVTPEQLDASNPDFVIIFPWNISDEVTSELKQKLSKEVQFVTAVPGIKVF